MTGGGSEILGDQYDQSQTEMMDEEVIIVNDDDVPIGSMSKVKSHLGKGTLHRAFSVLLFNSDGELLIQKRAATKITFPSLWANSCCSHPLNIESELKEDIGVKKAAVRKLEQELGITPDQVPISDFHFITRMHYYARADEKWIEREIDHILFIQADVELKINSNEIDEIKWVNQKQLESMLNNAEIGIAPWFRQINNRFLTHWWGHLNDMSRFQDSVIHRVGEIELHAKHTLQDILKQHAIIVDQKIVNSLEQSSNQRLRAAMLHLIEGGGKRLRAIMPWLVADACGNSNETLYDIGAAIEIIHNFTLIHDDIMDNDSLRRGRKSVHVEFDTPTAINAGDSMLALSFEIIANCPDISDNNSRTLVSIISNMVKKVAEGQQLDMDFESGELVTEEEYLNMISGKTAAMFSTCAKTGALLSGVSDDIVHDLSEWGENLGLCFQLIDDLIDVTGDSKTLGKPACSDVIEGKQTLIAIHALKQDDKKLNQFHQLFGCRDETATREDLDAVIDELIEVGSIDYARNKALEFNKKAHSYLDSLPESEALQILRKLTDWQLVRIS